MLFEEPGANLMVYVVVIGLDSAGKMKCLDHLTYLSLQSLKLGFSSMCMVYWNCIIY